MSKEDFYDLTPNQVLHAVEVAGFEPTGEFSQLNSYENRVFDIRLEGKNRVIAKFYRPGRWSQPAILEEHEFLNDLKRHGLPAIAPLTLRNGQTLGFENGIWYALWPKAFGRMVDELKLDDLRKLGRTLARFHSIGEEKQAQFRPIMDVQSYGWASLDILEEWVAPEVHQRYFAAAEEILTQLENRLNPKSFIRIHGDCHRGNILRTDVAGEAHSSFFFVDFDDFAMGHPVQDFWMLLSSDESSEEGAEEIEALLDGYREFRHFSESELELIPAFRGLRILHYAAWIARRWEDPSFPRLFPQYLEYNYWASETEALEALARRISA